MVMVKKKSGEAIKTKGKDVQDFLKKYPKPPPEHTYELQMEKKLEKMVREQKKEEAHAH